MFNAAGRHVCDEVRSRVTHLKALQVRRNLDDATVDRLSLSARQRRQKPPGDTGLGHCGSFHHLDHRPRLQPGKISRRLFDLGIGNALRCLDHKLRWDSLRDRSLPRATFEVGHLLHDVLCRKAGNTGIFRPARSIRSVAYAARHYVRLAAMSDDIRQRRVVRRMPIECEE